MVKFVSMLPGVYLKKYNNLGMSILQRGPEGCCSQRCLLVPLYLICMYQG